eukprot:6491619-Amphidinium_carterae.1
MALHSESAGSVTPAALRMRFICVGPAWYQRTCKRRSVNALIFAFGDASCRTARLVSKCLQSVDGSSADCAELSVVVRLCRWARSGPLPAREPGIIRSPVGCPVTGVSGTLWSGCCGAAGAAFAALLDAAVGSCCNMSSRKCGARGTSLCATACSISLASSSSVVATGPRAPMMGTIGASSGDMGLQVVQLLQVGVQMEARSHVHLTLELRALASVLANPCVKPAVLCNCQSVCVVDC